MKHIGHNVKALRLKRGWSQGDAAKILGISIPAFSKIETGNTDINLTRLFELAKMFEVSVLDILSKPGEHLAGFYKEEAQMYKAQLSLSEKEILTLQKKLIILYDELRAKV